LDLTTVLIPHTRFIHKPSAIFFVALSHVLLCYENIDDIWTGPKQMCAGCASYVFLAPALIHCLVQAMHVFLAQVIHVILFQLQKRSYLEEELSTEKALGRRSYLGNVQFIAELFKLRMVPDNIMHECIRRLLRSTFDETYLECVAILLTVAGKCLDKHNGKVGHLCRS
jgi:hypothetical protein